MNSCASDMFTWHACTSPLFCWQQGEDQIRSWSFRSEQGPLRLPSEALTQEVLGTGHVGTCRMWKIKEHYKPSSKLVKIVPCSVLKHSVLCVEIRVTLGQSLKQIKAQRDCSHTQTLLQIEKSEKGNR